MVKMSKICSKNSGVPFDLIVLSIDIDSNDYWVWDAIKKIYTQSSYNRIQRILSSRC